MVTPDNYTYSSGQGETYSGDDFDWELYDVTSGCANGTSLACDYSGTIGSTGYSATGAAGWGQVSNTDFMDGNGLSSSAQWNTSNVSLTAGNTYAILNMNYSTSTGGVTIDFQGTAGDASPAVMAPTVVTTEFDTVLAVTGCEAALSLTNGTVPNYTYDWDFGDGTTETSATPTDHFYTEPGTYIVEVVVTDALGCEQSFQRIIDVADCTPVPLPIELSSFGVSLIQSEVLIKWTTESETETDYFEIQRSSDLSNWEEIERVQGAGTSLDKINYLNVDNRPLMNMSYYRLKQVDLNGDHKYSSIRSVKRSTGASEIVQIVNIYGQIVSDQYKGLVYHVYADGTSKAIMQ